MKKILKAVFVIIGTLIGAGFASGQEIYLFFYQYGMNGILGIVISSLLLGFVTYKVLRISQENGVTKYYHYLNILSIHYEHEIVLYSLFYKHHYFLCICI